MTRQIYGRPAIQQQPVPRDDAEPSLTLVQLEAGQSGDHSNVLSFSRSCTRAGCEGSNSLIGRNGDAEMVTWGPRKHLELERLVWATVALAIEEG
jgi:hypothetical protein